MEEYADPSMPLPKKRRSGWYIAWKITLFFLKLLFGIMKTLLNILMSILALALDFAFSSSGYTDLSITESRKLKRAYREVKRLRKELEHAKKRLSKR